MQLKVDDEVPSRRRTRRSATRPLLLVGGAWMSVVAVHLFGIWVANLWLFAWAVYGLAWLTAIIITVAGVGSLWSKQRPALAVSTLVLSLLTATAVVNVDWTSAFVHGYYRLNRAGFATVATLANDDTFSADGYYGDRLPPRLRHLSVNGRAARIAVIDPPQSRDSARAHALFLPTWAGIPDGAVGYAYLVDAPATATFDCFADRCQARWTLGNGWYWLERI